MASRMASRLLSLGRLSRLLLKPPPSAPSSSNLRPSFHLLEASHSLHLSRDSHEPLYRVASRSFTSPPVNLNEGPAAIDYSSLLQEGEFHKLADSTIHELQEKFEEYGDSVQVDGFDIDYGNEVLTLKLGDLGTYVLNKQTPNRQIWLSSPVSGPFRFDWDTEAEAWIYRRTKVKLLTLLEQEMEQLRGEPISLSIYGGWGVIPRRIFQSAPMSKKYDIFTLETSDGVTILLRGLINKEKTKANGFPDEFLRLCFWDGHDQEDSANSPSNHA